MEKPNLSLFIAEQFPELYRDEFPQIITFMEKYYEYLETTESGKVDNLRDIDASLNRFIGSLKAELAKNVPSFGSISDEDFLKVAKHFYLSRGSEDSFKFLMRAMFGKSVDFIYPGDSVLRASDGRWTQEVSFRVQLSGPETDLVGTSNIQGNYFILKKGGIHFDGDAHSPEVHELGFAVLCTSVKKISDTIYDLFIDRAHKAIIETGDIFSFVNKDGIEIPGVIVDAIISATVLNGGPGIAVLTSAEKPGFFAGAAYVIPGAGLQAKDCIIRITTMDPNDLSRFLFVDIIAQGNGFVGTTYICIRPQTRLAYFISGTFGDFTDLTYNPGYQVGDAYIKLNLSGLMRYRGFYASTRGFLSDDIKIQDSNYYQHNSYVLRLDAQLATYKNAVMSLLHPDGMALWGQFELRNNISISPTLKDAIREFLQLLKDSVTAGHEVWLHDTTLVKPDISIGTDVWLHDTTLVKPEIALGTDVWLHNTTLVKPEFATGGHEVWLHDTTLVKSDIALGTDVVTHQTTLVKSDIALGTDALTHQTTLVKSDIALGTDALTHQTTLTKSELASIGNEVWLHNTLLVKPELVGAIDSNPIFNINNIRAEIAVAGDTGQIIVIFAQDYTSDVSSYFVVPETLGNSYLTQSGSHIETW